MPGEDRVESFYDAHARAHPELAGMLSVSSITGARYRHAAESRHFLRIVRPAPDWEVLDLGCGAGRWEFLLAPLVRRIVAVDLSRELIDLAEAGRQERGLANVEFVRASALDYQPAGSFDLIYFSGLLNYFSDSNAAGLVRRMADRLKPGGVILSRDTVHPAGRVAPSGDNPATYRPPAEYHAFFEAAGFRLAYSAESFRWPRLDGRFSRWVPESFQRRWPAAAMAAFVGLEHTARAAMKLGLLPPGHPEHFHLFMLYTRGPG